MNRKVFSERFNRELVTLDLPDEPSDKIKAISKVFDISRHLANALILGHQSPSLEELERISAVLEVCPLWLSGKTDKRRAYSRHIEEVA